MEDRLNRLQVKSRALFTAMQPDEYGDRQLVAHHKSGDYFWAGYILENNYIEPLSDRIVCPSCQALIWRTKRKMDVGGGLKNTIFSCRYTTAFSACSGDGFGSVLKKYWESRSFPVRSTICSTLFRT